MIGHVYACLGSNLLRSAAIPQINISDHCFSSPNLASDIKWVHYGSDNVGSKNGGMSSPAFTSVSSCSTCGTFYFHVRSDDQKGGNEKKLWRMGISTALAMTIHNVPEGLAGMVAG